MTSLCSPVFSDGTHIILMKLKCVVSASGEIVTDRRAFAVPSDVGIDKLDSW